MCLCGSSSALQFVVCRGLSEVLLAPLGRVYLSEIVSEFGPKTWPRSLVDFHTGALVAEVPLQVPEMRARGAPCPTHGAALKHARKPGAHGRNHVRDV